MSAIKHGLHWTSLVLLVILAIITTSTRAATRSIEQHQSADPAGSVEIVNVAGSVEVIGWDKPEVAVTGQVGDRVERVDITGADKHLEVRVVLPLGSHWSGDGEARLTIHVPQMSSLSVSVVSADLKIGGVSGAQQIHSVSGKVTTDGGGNSRVSTISGDVRVSLTAGSPAEVSTVSGDVNVRGAEGEISIKSVSGGGKLDLGTLTSFRLETVSGDFAIDAHLAPGAHFEASGVSGDLRANLAGGTGATFELSTLSGDISNCTDPKPTTARFGPGSHLAYTTGDGKASVQMSSKSGNLSLCSK
jgi:putative adhesin